jgi:hypothetical protein
VKYLTEADSIRSKGSVKLGSGCVRAMECLENLAASVRHTLKEMGVCLSKCVMREGERVFCACIFLKEHRL